MTEPCAVYSTRRTPFTMEEIEKWANGALVARNDNADGTEAIIVKWPDCTLAINKIPTADLREHLLGFRGYVLHCAGQMTQQVYALLQRTHLVHHCYGTTSAPSISAAAERLLSEMAAAGCGLLFRKNNVLSPKFDLLIGPEGAPEGAGVMYWQDALERRQHTSCLMSKRGMRTPESLPPVPGEQEVILRKPDEVGRRAWALYVVAYRAVPNGIGRRTSRELLEGNEDALTPAEAGFLKRFFPRRKAKVQFGWRFEALWVLLWALGVVEEMPFPEKPVEVSTIDAVLKRVGLTGLAQFKSLRPTAEILDHLDLIYRCHWITTDARVNGRPAPAPMAPDVISERHHAFNWLTNHENVDWDNVTTDT